MAEVEDTDVKDTDVKDTDVKDFPKYWLPGNVYKALKWVALIALPAVGLAYQAVAGIWSLPCGVEVMQTCSVAGLLCGVLIGASELKSLQGGTE